MNTEQLSNEHNDEGFEFKIETADNDARKQAIMYSVLQGHTSASIQQYEKSVVAQHTTFGAISGFKTKQDIVDSKKRLGIHRIFDSLDDAKTECEIAIATLEAGYEAIKTDLNHSLLQVDKIADELEQMFFNNLTILLLPRFKAEAIRKNIHSEFEIPKDSKLMLLSRFRLLRENYYTHGSKAEQCYQALLDTRIDMAQLSTKLGEINSKLHDILPLFEKSEQKDFVEFVGQHIVAKYRPAARIIKPIKAEILSKPPATVPATDEKIENEKKNMISEKAGILLKRKSALEGLKTQIDVINLSSKHYDNSNKPEESQIVKEAIAIKSIELRRNAIIGKILKHSQIPAAGNKKSVTHKAGNVPDSRSVRFSEVRSYSPFAPPAEAASTDSMNVARRVLPVMKRVLQHKESRDENMLKYSSTHLRFDNHPLAKSEQKIIITNTGKTNVQFRVKNIDLSIIPLITVNHENKKIGPGGCLHVEFQFTATNDDIEVKNAQIKFETSTMHEFCITVDISKPRSKCDFTNCGNDSGLVGLTAPLLAKLQESTLTLNMGTCVYGGSSSVWVELSNSGFVDTEFRVIPHQQYLNPGDIFEKDLIFEAGEHSPILATKGRQKLKFAFTPKPDAARKAMLSFAADYVVSFANTEPLFIKLKGVGVVHALVLGQSLLDLKHIHPDSIYHQRLDVTNNAATCVRFWLDFSPYKVFESGQTYSVETKIGTIELSTSFAFAQPQQTTTIWVTLRTAPELPSDFKIPFSVKYFGKNGHEQILVATLTGISDNPKVEIDSDCLDFGRASVLEKALLQITLSNRSHFRQICQLTSDNKCITINSHRYVQLEPLEVITKTVVFKPEAQHDYVSKVKCVTTKGLKSELEYRGVGIVPPLYFSSPLITLSSISVSQERSKTIQLKKSHTDSWDFEFGKPVIIKCVGPDNVDVDLEKAAISADIFKIWPSTGELSSQSALAVTISATSPVQPEVAEVVEVVEAVVVKEQKKKGPIKKSDAVSTMNLAQEVVAEDKWSPVGHKLNWLIPCRLKPKRLDSSEHFVHAAPVPLIQPHYSEWVIYLSVQTEFEHPTFTLSENLVQFSKHFVNQSKTKTIAIKNNSEVEIKIHVSGINPVGPFYIAKNTRPIPAGGIGQLLIGFRPTCSGSFFSVLEITSGGTIVAMKVLGQSINPTLQTESVLDFGHVLIDEAAAKNLILCNPTSLPIECFLRCNSTFSVPFRQTVPALGQLEVPIKLLTSRPSEMYKEALTITFNAQELVVVLFAKVWATTCSAAGHDAYPVDYKDTLSTTPYDLMKSAISTVRAANDDLTFPAISSKDLFFCTFDSKWILDQNKWTVEPQELILSNLKCAFKPDKKSISLEYSVEFYNGTFYYDQMLKDYQLKPMACEQYFSCDLQKGSIESGQTKSFTFTESDPQRTFYRNCANAWEKVNDGLLNYYTGKAKSREKVPVAIESVFKIVVTGGIRLVEPRAILGPEEPITFYVKICAEPSELQ